MECCFILHCQCIIILIVSIFLNHTVSICIEKKSPAILSVFPYALDIYEIFFLLVLLLLKKIVYILIRILMQNSEINVSTYYDNIVRETLPENRHRRH